MCRQIFGFFVILLPFLWLISCDKNSTSDLEALTFTRENWFVSEGEAFQLVLEETVPAEMKLIWKSTDESVASVDRNGVVSAKKAGFAEITVLLSESKVTSSVNVFVLKKALDKIGSQLSNELIYSKGTYLVRNTVIQCFDIAQDGTVFYDQLGGGLPHVIFVVRGQANQPYSDYMQLKYFGHGTNMAIEEQGSNAYVWINSNGTKKSDGSYGSNQTFSRLKYEAGGVAEKYSGETYYLPEKTNIHPAVDVENDLLAVTTSGGGDPFRYFYFYKLSEAKALAEEQVTLSALTFGGEEAGGPMEQTEKRTLKVKNLGKLTPVSFFKVSQSVSPEKTGYYAFQGFDVADGYLYFYEGEGNENTVSSGPSNAFVSVFSMDGTLVKIKTKIQAISDLNDLEKYGITATGYMEAEGIKVKNDGVYLGFASKSTDDKRKANILVYR
ncbi:Ig-like domain (group 2) [Mariniphaga anaerophila]|uniref:Ig-like domain (Group 2) n=1 Tax=Mariniphaga anaerophila TaxID=1484053 RepID=A0A1M4V6L0_9BACT|nr:Ig-like domain-containing protein [Mariniphaga anaerophila]SHE64542.1 Ig-like domain (group 2) [Mariniphaga anaerophila]